jgi:hypothetical protein
MFKDVMSVFLEPRPGSIRCRTQLSTRIPSNQSVVDVPLYSEGADYLYNIMFHTHPLLMARNGDMDHYRLSSADVDCVQLIVNGQVVSTIPNYFRNEPIVHRTQINGIYSTNTDFFNGDPIATGLLNGDLVMRVVFWREPVAPFWITYQLADAQYHMCSSYSWWAQYRTRAFDGKHMIYSCGTIVPEK